MAVQLTGLRYVSEGYAGFISSARNATSQVNELGRALGATTGRGAGFNALRTVAVGAFLAIGAAAANAARNVLHFFSGSIEVAGNFEAEMNKFQSIVGKSFDTSGQSMAQFSKLFISLGKELPITTSEVVEAAIEMVKGGLDPATVAAGSLRQVILFASAAHTTLADAAYTAAKAVAAWVPLEASAVVKTEFLTRATDFMTRAANASTTEIKDLSTGIQNAQGNARAAGATFEDTATTVALLAPAFRSGTEAGTAMGTFISRLPGTTKPAREALQHLGLWSEKTGSAFYDAQGKFVGMRKVTDLLSKATKNLTDYEREYYLQKIFGQRGIKAATALAFAGAEGYDAMSRSIARQNGVMESWMIIQRGFNYALEQVKGSLEALQIVIGGPLRSVLTEFFLRTLKPGIDTITTLAQAVLGDRDSFNELSPAMKGVSDFITGSFLPGVKELATIVGGALSIAFKFINDHLHIFGLAIETIGQTLGSRVILGAIILITDALLKLINPFNIITAAIFGLRLAWETNFMGIRDVVIPILDTIKTVASDVATSFSTGGLSVAISTLSSDLLKFTGIDISPFITAMEALGGAITTIANAFATGGAGEGFSTFADQLRSLTGIDLTPIITTFSDIKTWLDTNIPAALTSLKGQWDIIWPDIKQLAGDVAILLGNVAKAMGDVGTAAAIAEPKISSLVDVALRALDEILKVINGHFDQFEGALIALGGAAVIGIAIGALEKLGLALMAVDPPVLALYALIAGLGIMWNTKIEQMGYETETMGTRAERGFGRVKDAITGAVQWLGDKQVEWTATMEAWRLTVEHGIQGAVAQWQIFKFNTSVIFGDIGNIISGFIGKLTSVWDFIQKVGRVFEDLRSPAQDIYGDFAALGRVVGDFIGGLDGLIGVIQSVIGWLQRLGEKIASIHIPSDLIGNSPSPFELSLRGITEAMVLLSQAIGMAGSAFEQMSGLTDDLMKKIDSTNKKATDLVEKLQQSLLSGRIDFLQQWGDNLETVFEARRKASEMLQEAAGALVGKKEEKSVTDLLEIVQKAKDALDRAKETGDQEVIAEAQKNYSEASADAEKARREEIEKANKLMEIANRQEKELYEATYEAQQTSEKDPENAAKLYKLKVEHINSLAELDTRIVNAKDEQERQMLLARRTLLVEQYALEEQLEKRQAQQRTQQIQDQIKEIADAWRSIWTDPSGLVFIERMTDVINNFQIAVLALAGIPLPPVITSPGGGGAPPLPDRSKQGPVYIPPPPPMPTNTFSVARKAQLAGASQIMANSAMMVNNTYSPSFNLGVHTNNSPGVVIQSYEIMRSLYG